MSVPRFWREIPQRYTLQASRCGVCKATFFPPREVCPTCRRQSIGRMDVVRLSGAGTVLESTRVHKAAPGFELQVPYVIVLVQTPEGPIVTGQLVDQDPADGNAAPKPGTAVRAVFRRLGADGDAGVIYYGTKWRLATTQDADLPPADAVPAAESKGKRRLGRKDKGT